MSSDHAGKTCYKGFHLIDGVPICSKGGATWTEYKVGKYVSAPSNTPLRLCENGIHVCLEPLDCLHFYEPADSNMVLGIVQAFGMSSEEDNWTTKRVSRTIRVDSLISLTDNYDAIGCLVQSRAVGTRQLSANEDFTGRPHADVITYDDRVWVSGVGWTIGDVNDVLLAAGNYSYVSGGSGDDVTANVAVTFGGSSMCVGIVALAMGGCSIARTIRIEGFAFTAKYASIAVADHRLSVAVSSGPNSRAVANAFYTTAVAQQYSSLVVLNRPGTVGVAYGSALVTAEGCTVVLVPSRGCNPYGPMTEFYYGGCGTIKGVDGTYVVVFDLNYMRWRGVYLKENDPTFPADQDLDVQWVVEKIKSEKL